MRVTSKQHPMAFFASLMMLSAATVQADATSDSNRIFDWAEVKYPQYFSPAGSGTETVDGFIFRYYGNTNSYLGTNSGLVYVFGDLAGSEPLAVGTVDHYLWASTIPSLPVDTGQVACYNATTEISCPQEGNSFFGQDGHYSGNSPSYVNNGDGTVTDIHTGLTWSQAVGDKLSLTQAMAAAESLTLGGYSDWRIPTIKELYTLIDFTGYTGTGSLTGSSVPANAVPFMDTVSFDFAYGDTSAGERYIDAQWLTTTLYVTTTMEGDNTLFGVNFADGRIKGYGYSNDSRPNAGEKEFYVRYVRGNSYGENQFTDNGNDTISDAGSGQMWTKKDSGAYSAGSGGDGSMDWPEALAWCEGLSVGGHSDWRLPNAKELQFIVDYTRSPATTGSAAIDPIFESTSIIDEKGDLNFPYFWTSTTHLDGPSPSNYAAYIAFGEALGIMNFGSGDTVYDVHGAGAQRSDPKTGNPDDITTEAPQGDIWRIYNYARCVRDI